MKHLYILLSLLCLTAAGRAQTRLTLQQCLEMAQKQSYEIQVSDKSIERSRALQGTAWDVEKTELSLSQDPTSGGSPDNALSLSQTIDFPTLYIARHKQLKAETQAERSRQQIVRNELTAEVTGLYLQWVYEHRRLTLLCQQDSTLDQYRLLAEKRYQAGEIRRLEVMEAERLQKENKLEIATVKSEEEKVRLQLERLLQTPDIEPADTRLQPLGFTASSFQYTQTANGQYASDRLSVADKQVSVAQNGYAPSLSLSLRNQLVISGWDPYHQNRSRFDGGNFMGFEVGVGIPLFYGATKAKVKAAKKDREMIQLEIKAEQQRLEKEYQAALSRINAAYTKMDYYQQEGTKKADEMARLGALEYQNGEITYVEYNNVLQETIDIRLKQAAAINEYNQSVVALQKLTAQ